MPDYVDQQYHHDPLDTQDLLGVARKSIVAMRAGLLEIKDDMHHAKPSRLTQIRTPSHVPRTGFSMIQSSFLQAADNYSGSLRWVSTQGSAFIAAQSGDIDPVVHGQVDGVLGVMALASAAELPAGGELLDGPIAGPPPALLQISGSTCGSAQHGRRKLIADAVMLKQFL